jgi:hypothetical protein
MAIALYFDVHVDHAIASQLRLRGIDVLTAQEDGANRLADDALLDRASSQGRPLVTHGIRLFAMAEDWQRRGRAFVGVIFAHLMQVSICRCVRDLEILAEATDAEDWVNATIRLPM